MTFTRLYAPGKTSLILSSVLALTGLVRVATVCVAAGWAGNAPIQAQAAHPVAKAPAAKDPAVKDPAAFAIKRVYKVGETDRFTVTSSISATQTIGEPVEMVWNLTFKEKTTTAKTDGSSTVTAQFEKATLSVNGMDTDFSDSMPNLITTHDTDGNADVKMEEGDGEVREMIGEWAGQLVVSDRDDLLPSNPVKVGDSWEIDPDSFEKEAGKVTGKSTLLSVEVVQGVKVAKIQQIMDVVDEMSSKRHIETTVFVEIATGKPMSLTTKITASSDEGTVTLETTMKRILPEKKAAAPPPAKSGAKKP